MKDDPLKPEHFPLRTEKKKIVTSDGKPVAQAADEPAAEEIAERLNIEETQREEDRWSA
ncbi:hypothetical protein [Bradyrhizobium sp. OAE829]|uniref:hypothetical protein n=1 Tax=Bradyrhizobium sp. OAE829 TaxID=2663807 RepID=UPI00178B6DD8